MVETPPLRLWNDLHPKDFRSHEPKAINELLQITMKYVTLRKTL
jgi:hypothetical protein